MSEQLTAADVLERAAETIERPGAWTQGWYARSEDGTFAEPNSDAATCFCAIGAIRRTAGQAALTEARALRLMRTAIEASSIHDWNDAEGRTQAEVAAKLREAAALARAEAAQ